MGDTIDPFLPGLFASFLFPAKMYGCFFTAKPHRVKSVNPKCPLVDRQELAALGTGRR